MSTAGKILVTILALLGIVFVAATFIVGQRAAAAVEQHTSHALGVPAQLDRARVNLLTGGVRLTVLQVDNPQGFPSMHFKRIGDTDGRIRLTTLLDEIIELPRLTLSEIELHLDRREGVGNYERILDHYLRVGRHVDVEPRRYVIRELVLRDIVVHLDLLPEVGEVARLSVPIEEIRLTDVGTEADGGVMLQEVAGVVVQALLAAVLERAGQELPGVVARELASRLGRMPEIQRIREIGEDLLEDPEGVLRDLDVEELLPGRRPRD